MSEQRLHLVKVPLRADRLVSLAKRRHIPIRDLDDGYLTHCLLTELWQATAPAPFVLRGAGRTLDVWGYSQSSAPELIDHARAFGDPAILDTLDGVETISSKAMPRFERGRRVGFLARVCPVARLSKSTNGHRAGAEVDVFLSKAFVAGSTASLAREAIYREWFTSKLSDPASTGVLVERVRVAAIARTRLVRRTQGDAREARPLERPDVRVEGDLVIDDGNAFLRFLAHGIGRHRAFGFGALIVVPPGTSHALS
ncbi:MAG: type I-E CRISPR-associated protein Cas6/Cse3/CasE [Gemmatimonadaceae bacterium]